MMMIETAELRCERHLHGKLLLPVYEVKCSQCSQRGGPTVYHRWAIRIEPLPDQTGERGDPDDNDVS